MSSSIYPSRYKDQEAISIESGKIRAQFLPKVGAKMCSLIYKPLDFSVLVQRPGERYLLQPYDGDYVAGECSGLDDTFPTIDACYYPEAPWQGTPIPDHGEVWGIPWQHQIEGERLYFLTYGVRLPYKLEKWVSVTEGATLHIDYRLTNHSPFDLDFLWGAHGMFILSR